MLGLRDRWEFHQDKAGFWHWQRIARNGEILEESPGYKVKQHCIANAERNGYNPQDAAPTIYSQQPE